MRRAQQKTRLYCVLSVKLTLTLALAEVYYLSKFPLENRGIDPRTSRMLSERSTI